MQTKILLLALSAAAFSSCSTAYKSGQTPDDVYYSPVQVVDEDHEKRQDDKRDEVKNEPAVDYEISMGIRDHRWRDFRDDYGYDYSPYNYTCKNYNYGYYYNPYYYPWAIYTTKITYSKPVNTTPRMVNLNTYNGYNKNVASGKTSGINWTSPSSQYNNSNRKGVGNIIREVITPSGNSSSSSNNSRTYTPPPSNNSGSSSSGSNSGSVSRPRKG